MAEPRMSQLLPTIRCGTCGNNVAYRDLGTHICEEAPPMPPLPLNLKDNNSTEKQLKPKGDDLLYEAPYSPGSPNSPDDVDDSGYNSRAPSSGRLTVSSKDGGGGRLSASGVKPSMSFFEKYNRLVGAQGGDIAEHEGGAEEDDYDDRADVRSNPRSARRADEDDRYSDSSYGRRGGTTPTTKTTTSQGRHAAEDGRRPGGRDRNDGDSYTQERRSSRDGFRTDRSERSDRSEYRDRIERGRNDDDERRPSGKNDYDSKYDRRNDDERRPSGRNEFEERNRNDDERRPYGRDDYDSNYDRNRRGDDDRRPSGRNNDYDSKYDRSRYDDDARRPSERDDYDTNHSPRGNPMKSSRLNSVTSQGSTPPATYGGRDRFLSNTSNNNRDDGGRSVDGDNRSNNGRDFRDDIPPARRPSPPSPQPPAAAAAAPVYAGRDRGFDNNEDRYRSRSNRGDDEDYRRRDSMVSSSRSHRSDPEGDYDAQNYIERKYGIMPPKEKEPLKPSSSPVREKIPESQPADPPPPSAPATSSAAPLGFFRNLFGSAPAAADGAGSEDSKSRDGKSRDDDVTDLNDRMAGLGRSPISAAQLATRIEPQRNRDPDAPANIKAKCTSCRRGIYDSEVSLEAIGKSYHMSCLRCDQCDVPLDDRTKFRNLDGKILCERKCAPSTSSSSASASASGDRSSMRSDSAASESSRRDAARATDPSARKRELICTDCRKPITGRPVFAFKKPFHENHLRCQHCRSPIVPGVGHVEHEGSVYCPDDFSLLYLPKCRMCKLAIDGEAVCALNGKWHPACFGCQICQKPFPDKSFYVFDNNPLCRRHYHEQNNSICLGCDEPIEGACAQVQQDPQYGGGLVRYHPPCFCCNECRRPLHDVYYNFKGRPYCERHIMEIQRKKNIRVERRKTVFSMLPPGN